MILRKCSDPQLGKTCPSYPVPSSALRSVLVQAESAMQREVKGFIAACIAEGPKDKSRKKGGGPGRGGQMSVMDPSQLDVERGIFSLGITSGAGGGLGHPGVLGGSGSDGWKKGRLNIAELPAGQFVSNVLLVRTGTDPEVRHALTFRRSVSRWTHEVTEGRKELALSTGEDSRSGNAQRNASEEGALSYMDNIIQRTLLPEMQDEAVNAVIHFLERGDAFDPIAGDVFSGGRRSRSSEAEMSVACQALYASTRPIFMALHRLPRGGDMYLSLATMLEHAMLTFISRMKQRVGEVCHGKAAFALLEDLRGSPTPLSNQMERRGAFGMFQRVYSDEDDLDDADPAEAGSGRSSSAGGILPLAPPENDTSLRRTSRSSSSSETGRGSFEREVAQIDVLTKFDEPLQFEHSTLCSDEELMRAACLANSLLTVAGLLDRQLGSSRAAGGWGNKSNKIKAIRDLRGAIRTIRHHGLRVAKFCRVEVLIQT